MNYKIISINSHKTATALIAISAIAAVLVVSTVAIGSARIALAQTETDTVTKNLNNTGINVQTNTNQKQDCDTAGGKSGIGGGDDGFHWGFGDDRHDGGSCTATSSHSVDQSGGILKKGQEK
jgi:hypothetical protein